VRRDLPLLVAPAVMTCLASLAAPTMGASSLEVKPTATGLTLQSPGDPAPIVHDLRYVANDDAGLAFQTKTASLAPDGTVSFTLDGPAAPNAAVGARVTPLEHGVSLDWVLRYSGPKRSWNHWTSGLYLDFGREVAGVRTQPVIKWVKSTGEHPWEVPGDTPYADTECQLREVLFGDTALAMVCSSYDADWVYGNDRDRARFARFTPPAETPGQVEMKLAFLLASSAELDPACLATEAAGRPLALSMTTDRLGNLFAPGETAALRCAVSNVTGQSCQCELALDAYSYEGERLLSTSRKLELPARGREAFTEAVSPKQRGVVFIAARLAWDEGETIQRMTLGFLPERAVSGARPDSAFGMAAVIASPDRYPDQRDLDTVLDLMQRVGVRWIRSGWFPLKSEVTDADEKAVRGRVELLKAHGILPHVQLGASLPKPEELADFRQRLAASIERFKWVTPYVEVANELNLGGLSGADYVSGMLRPIHEVMRQVFPEGKVMSMGLGGVHKDWLDSFVAAGGMELIDVLSVHPGCQPRAPEFWEGWRGWVFRSQMLDAAKAARERGGKAVWITEAYAPTAPQRSFVDLRTSADYLVRTYVSAAALGVQVTEWYQFQDGVWYAQRPDPSDVEFNFGVVYTDLSPKPAYLAYGAMTEQLEGATCQGRLDLGADDLYRVRFVRDRQPVDVLWSYREKHETDLPWWPPENYQDKTRYPGEPWVERWKAPVTVTLPAGGTVTVIDLMGNARTAQPQAGKVELRLTGSPVYVRGLGDIPRLPRLWPDAE